MSKEVELLPWAHTLRAATHGNIVDYVSKLPKGSTVFMECSWQDLELMEANYTRPTTKPLDKLTTTILEFQEAFAIYELYKTCRDNGHKILALDSGKHKDAVVIAGDNRDYSRFLMLNEYREHYMARQIEKYFQTHKGKVFVVAGSNHTEYIKAILEKYKIYPYENLDVIPDIDNLLKYRLIENRFRTAIKAGDLELAKACFYLITERSMDKIRGNQKSDRSGLDLATDFGESLIANAKKRRTRVEKKYLQRPK